MICNIIIKRPTRYFNRPNTQFHNCDTFGKGVMFHEEIDNKNKIITFPICFKLCGIIENTSFITNN